MAWGFNWLGEALRSLCHARGMTLAIVATIGLGVGANASVFSVLQAVLLQSLPYPEAGRLVTLAQRGSLEDADATQAGYVTFDDWRAQAKSVSHLAAYGEWTPTLELPGGVEQVPGMRVTRGFFATLGIAPQLGREFGAEDDTWDRRNDGVMLDHGYWQHAFGGARDIVGRKLRLLGREMTVIGVLPASFRPHGFGSAAAPPQVWAALGYDREREFACRTCQHLEVIARLAPGVTLQGARSEFSAIAQRLARAHPGDYPRTADVRIEPLAARVVGSVSRLLWMVFAAVGLVLLIAVANVAALLGVRALARTRELALRGALGATPRRLTRLLLGEAALLGLFGGLAGLGVSALLLPVLRRVVPSSMPRLQDVSLDASVFGYAMAVALVSCLVAAWVPAWHARLIQPSQALKQSASSTLGGKMRGQRIALALQVALALVVLSCGALLSRSFERVLASDPGFEPEHLASGGLSLAGPAFAEDESITAFHDSLLESLRNAPGVRDAALVSPLPLSGGYDRAGFHRRSMPLPSTDAPDVDRGIASAGYFQTMGIPLLQGRGFTSQDRADSAPVVVVNRTLAERYWPAQDPIGQQIQTGGLRPDGPWSTVVGVVGDVRQSGLDQSAAPQVYLPLAQRASRDVAVVVRMDDPEAALAVVRDAVRKVNPGVALSGVAPYSAQIAQTLATRRFVLLMVAAFAVVGVLLAAIGVHGTLAGAMARRQREIGLRVALGAPRARIARWAMARGMLPVAAGIAIGAIASVPAAALIRDQLVDVSPQDPLSMAGAALVMTLAALIACARPVALALREPAVSSLRQD